MTAPKFTPGPWQLEDNDIYSPGPVGSRELISCAYGFACPPKGQIVHTPETMANARLIAAAPELFDLVVDLLPYARASIGLPEPSWPTDSVILKAREIIARIMEK